MRIGVIGIGIMGFNHARVLADLQGAELVGLVDPDTKLVKKHAASLNTKAFSMDGSSANR